MLRPGTRGRCSVPQAGFSLPRKWYHRHPGIKRVSREHNTTTLSLELIKEPVLSRFVPRDPEMMKDFDADLPWCTLSSGENIVKGDILLENGKRIVMFSTNSLLDMEHSRSHQSYGIKCLWYLSRSRPMCMSPSLCFSFLIKWGSVTPQWSFGDQRTEPRS